MPCVLITTSSFNLNANASMRAAGEAGFDIVLNPHGRRLSEDEAALLFREKNPEGVIAGVEPLTRRVMAAAPALRVVSRCGAGLDSVDLDAAREMDINVVRTPNAPARAVAELTVGLMLAALRRIAEGDRAVRAGTWPSLTGGHLGSRTVGFIGLGNIGQRVAALLAPFGCRLVGCDPVVSRAPDPVEMMDLDMVLAAADVVTLHVPLTPATHGLIGAEQIARMRPGALLVNTSRGGLVDEDALAAALRSGRLGGASLDVFEAEPYIGPLAAMENVVMTPHLGSRAAEMRDAMEEEAAANLCAAFEKIGIL